MNSAASYLKLLIAHSADPKALLDGVVVPFKGAVPAHCAPPALVASSEKWLVESGLIWWNGSTWRTSAGILRQIFCHLNIPEAPALCLACCAQQVRKISETASPEKTFKHEKVPFAHSEMAKRTADTPAHASSKASKLMSPEAQHELKAELAGKFLFYCSSNSEGRCDSRLIACELFTAAQLAQMVSNPSICNEDRAEDHPYLTEKEYEDMLDVLHGEDSDESKPWAKMAEFTGKTVAFALYEHFVL